MVVVGLHAQSDTLVVPCFLRRLDEIFGEKLSLFVEIVASTLRTLVNFARTQWRHESTDHVNEHLKRSFPLLDELSRVVLLPLVLLVLPKVSFESLLSPRAIDWVGNRSERGHRLVLARVFEELI